MNFNKLASSEVLDFTDTKNKVYEPLFKEGGEQTVQEEDEEDGEEEDDASEDLFDDEMDSIGPMHKEAARKRRMEEHTQKEWILNELLKMGNSHYSINMPLQELEFYYARAKRQQDKESSVRFFKDVLCIGVNGIEMLSKWTKIGRLDGWSNSITADMGRFDNALSALYDRYFKKGGTIHPIMELLFVLVSSMVVWHFKGSFLPPPPSMRPPPATSGIPFDIPISIDRNVKKPKAGGMPRLDLNK